MPGDIPADSIEPFWRIKADRKLAAGALSANARMPS